MYCPKCGNNIKNGALFCPKCGYRVSADERTKEINVGIIKDITGNLNLKKEEKKQNIKNNKINDNKTIVMCCGIVVVTLIIILLIIIIGNKNDYVASDDIEQYCSQNKDAEVCKEPVTVVNNNYDPLDFSEYSFDGASSINEFTNQVLSVLKQKEQDGNNFCNNKKYEKLNKKIDEDLNLKYSYTCGVDSKYMNNLSDRLQKFYKLNNIKENLVDSYLVGKREFNVYADYSTLLIGIFGNYYAYLRRVYLNQRIFSDYDLIMKMYKSDIESKFHPINSIPEDVIVHETAHAFDYYINAKENNSPFLTGDNYKDYQNSFNDMFVNATFSKWVVTKAAKNVNDRLISQGKSQKSEEELRNEISGYANQKNEKGEVMYWETFAEAMVDYLSNGEKAKPLSVEIYKLTQEKLKELGG